MHKIIIDTDPGIDDAMAIFFALAAPDIELVGCTSVFGNVETVLATENTLRLLEIAGQEDIPVARGAARPLAMPYRGPVEFVHGADGQGNTHLPPPRTTAISSGAVEFMRSEILASPGDITIVTLGPLTNLALLVLQYPELVSLVRGVVSMGGNAWTAGNASPAAEANILNDPEAADLVFSAGWPLTMCGLDVTHQIIMTASDLDRAMAIDSTVGRHLARILPFYRDFYERNIVADGIYVHDSTTISYLRHPELFTNRMLPVFVDTSPGIGRGKTWPGRGNEDRPAITICRDVDARAVIEHELATLEAASVGDSTGD